MPTDRRKVLLIGWDAADWKVIHPLLDAGKMPTLERLINHGVIGDLMTLDPPLSPMLWTSIATSKAADEHGILGFVQPNATGDRLQAVLGSSRKAKAVWNILSQEGMKTNVIGWWPSHPADAINGVMVSNFYHRAAQPIWAEWPMLPGTVYPPELSETLAAYRVHPSELTRAHLEPFAPFLSAGTDSLSDEDRKRTESLGKVIADAAGVQAAATWALEHTEWDFTAVYFDAIDHFCHGFMRFHPPQLPYVDDERFAKWSHVIEAGYRFHDMMLDRLVTLAGPETTVMLVSDHGFHSDHLRLKKLPKEPASPAYEHRDHGIFVLSGPGIRQDAHVHSPSLMDVTPTLLTLFGLPVGADMRGKPILSAFDDVPEVQVIPSWEDVDGAHGMSLPPVEQPVPSDDDLAAEAAAMEQLVALGYIDEVPVDKGRAYVEASARESQFYLARAYRNTGRPEQALPILETLVDQDPEQDRYAMLLGSVLLQLGHLADARRVTEAHAERVQARMAQKGVDRPIPGIDMQLGMIALAEGNVDDALVALERACETSPHFPHLHRRIGNAYLKAGRLEEAEAALRRSIDIDPGQASAFRALSVTYARQHRYEEAAEAALSAIGLQYTFPVAHYSLGVALMRLGEYARAAEAFEVAVQQSPGIRKAHQFLAELYRVYLDRPDLAGEHLTFMEQHIADG